ncbi:MAG: undecaprenyl-diphosphate phosphatase [Mariniblastus sp.]|nr:undecaprenyl-diphosphate phosphatase [Mariniblastus sp.]
MAMITVSETLKVVILSVVQGIAEFLPISSSGHLVVINELLGTGQGSIELNVILHLGTLFAILGFYWRRVWALLGKDRRVIPQLIVGTIPAAVIGLTIKRNFEDLLTDPLLTGFMFPITGGMLLLLIWIKPGDNEYQRLTYRQVVLIGVAQAFALLPGISRSGSTIVAGSLLGLKRQSAATFSFLLAIPAIAGAGLLEVKDMLEAGQTTTPPGLLLLGAVIAFVVGLGSLQWLVKWIEAGWLYLFAYWLIPLGIVVVVWQLFFVSSATV